MNRHTRHKPAGMILVLVFTLTVLPKVTFSKSFGAKLIEVEGFVTVVSFKTKQEVAARVDMRLVPGDTLRTGADAMVEIEFDDGNVSSLDEYSNMTIRKLDIEDDASQQTILDLAIGKIKNSVSKMIHKRSRFEVHTKSAIIGVTGTPPWIVRAINTANGQRTEVDLLGNPFDEGQLFVRGLDLMQTEVQLTPGTRAVVEFGYAPSMPKRNPNTSQRQMMQHISQEITVPEFVTADEITLVEETESQFPNQDINITPSAVNVSVQINLSN